MLPEASRAASSARADNVCLVRLDVAGCLAEVRSVVARAQTQAGAAGAPSNDGGTELMGVTVRHPLTGQPLQQFADTAAIGRNRRIPLEGLGYLVLNEQLCDHGVGTAPMCSSEHSSGLIVRAMHLLVTVPNNALGLVAGTELVVGDAHFGAEYRPIQ